MKYLSKLSKNKTFTFKDVIEIVNDKNIALKTIQNYLSKGYIKKIKRDLYSAVSFETTDIIANKFDIASSITATSFVSHHSAFEFYGYYNQVYSYVDVSSITKFNSFEFDDNFYIYTRAIDDSFVNTIDGVRVTSIERTIVDCINSSGKKCELEEILNCISSITYISFDKMLIYLESLGNKILYKKVGIIMSLFKKQFDIPESFFDTCHKVSDSIKGYFENSHKEALTYNSEWKIFIYKNIEKLLHKE